MTAVVKRARFEADFTERALDLNEANPAAALRFVKAVEAAIKRWRDFPEIGPVWRDGSPERPTRDLLVPGFHNDLPFYRDEGGEVWLGRLRHGVQDLRSLLDD